MQKDNLFITAAAKSRERFLLGTEKLNRLAEARSYEEGMRLLGELGFSKLPEGATLAEILFAEEQSLIDFVKEYSPKSGCGYYFLLPYDFLNAEAVFKRKKTGQSLEGLTAHEGAFTLREIIEFSDGRPCPIEEISSAFTMAEALFEEGSPSGALVDTVFFGQMYKAVWRMTKDKVIRRILKLEVDLKNLSTLLRVDDMEEYYLLKLPMGTLTASQEEAVLTRDPKVMREAFKGTELEKFILLAVKEMGSPLVGFERLMEGFALKRLKEDRFFIRGTEPFILYCMYKRADVKNVRLIMVSLYNGVESQVIKAKLREAYN